jgi:uncharacterized protein (DUF1697 family)
MPPQIALLRGINIRARNRISMAELRNSLSEAGFHDARTYVQSGNVVMSSDLPPERLARELEQLIAKRFSLDIRVVVRTRAELAKVVGRNPLGDVADDPKRYQVTFLSGKLGRDVIDRLKQAAAPSERYELIGLEVYAWHPDGVARSKLWSTLAGQGLGVAATSRNWTTVEKLLALADE